MADVTARPVKDGSVWLGKTGNISEVMILLASGIDINVTSSDKKCPINHGTCLHLAVQYGREQLVRVLLLSPEINIISVNMYKDTPVTAAVRRGHVWGTQFHPEKSSRAGFRLLRNFIEGHSC